jgi:hypothetical protein
VLLRDPFARLASCFLDKIVSRLAPAQQLNNGPNGKLNLDDMTFADFVEMLRSPEIRAADVHWRPQVHFLVYEQYDDYFAVEDFADAARTIKNRAGLDIVDARPLTVHGIDRYRLLPEGLDHSKTTVAAIAQLQSKGECPHPRSLYTERLVKAVSRFYAADFSLYAEKIGLPALFPAPDGLPS